MSKKFIATDKHKEKQWKEASKLLNEIVCIKLAPSPIHGVGVFAVRDIKKGEKLHTNAVPHAFDLPYDRFLKLKKHVQEVLLNYWAGIPLGSHFLYPVTKMTAFINHAEEPNYDATADITLKDIKAGEEIVENYKLTGDWEKVFPFLL